MKVCKRVCLHARENLDLRPELSQSTCNARAVFTRAFPRTRSCSLFAAILWCALKQHRLSFNWVDTEPVFSSPDL